MAPTAPLTVTVESKFMQNFHVASPFNPGAGLCSVRNGSGDTEFFSIGSDQAVYNYHADPDSDTGYAAAPIGIFASAIAVALSASGAIVVFAVNGATLTMVTEQPGHGQRWSAPAQVQVPMPSHTRAIAGLHLVQVGGTCHLALLVQTRAKSAEAAYHLVLGTMADRAAPTFQQTGLVLGSLNCTWLCDAPQGVRFVCADGLLVAVSALTGQATPMPLPPRIGQRSIGVTQAVDGQGQSRLFAVLDDGDAHELVESQGGCHWEPLTRYQRFNRIAAQADGRGEVHLLCTADDRLFHLRPDRQRTAGWAEPRLVLDKVSAFAMNANDDGDVEAFAGHAGSLSYLAWNTQTREWDVLPVALPHSPSVEEHSAYHSEVQLRDAAGAPLRQTSVTITASRPTKIIVRGALYAIDAHRAALVCTNESGTLNIQQPVGTLAASTLVLRVPGWMPADEAIAVSPDMVNQPLLAGLTGDRLLAATRASGAPVLPEALRQRAPADAMAAAVAQIMQLAVQTVALPAAASVQARRVRPGVVAMRQRDARQLRRLDITSARHWRLATAHGAAQFQFLNAAEARQHLHLLRATSRQSGGFVELVNGIGDLVVASGRNLVEITETLLTVVDDRLRVAIKFVVAGATCLYEEAIDSVDPLFDLVQAVFAQAQVHFEALYGWLGSHFDWAEIARTAKAMNYTVQQFLGFFQGAIGGMRAFFGEGPGPLQDRLDKLFDQAIRSVGEASIGDCVQSLDRDDPLAQGALSNNPIFAALLDNASALRPCNAFSQALAAARGESSEASFAAIERALRDCADAAIGHPGFAALQRCFTEMGSADGQPLATLLREMLGTVRGLIQAVASGLQSVADQLLGLLQAMMGTLTAALNAQWQAPSLSPLFRHASGGMPMSTLNLISLAMAIPATALYRQAYRRAPFESDEELIEFEHAWDANTLLRASGLRGESALGSQRALMRVARLGSDWSGLLPPKAAPVMAILGAVAPCFHAGFAAVTDARADIDRAAPLSTCSFVANVLAQAASCPWFYAAGTMGCGGERASYLNWTCANLGTALDLLYLVTDDSISPDVQSVTSHLYGSIQLAMAVLASTGQAAPASGVLAVVPNSGRILRFSGIVAATQGVSLAVLASLDAICLPVASAAATARIIDGTARLMPPAGQCVDEALPAARPSSPVAVAA